MEPNYLKVNELTYEVAIRGHSARDIDQKRKILRACLRKESQTKIEPVFSSVYSFENDVSEIIDTIKDIKSLLDNPPEGDSTLLVRLQTRLIHISGRVNRLLPAAAKSEQADRKDQLVTEVLILEGDLAEKLNVTTNFESDISQTPILVQPSIPRSDTSSSVNKVYKWGVSFTGQESPDQIFEFLTRIEELRIARGLTKADLLQSAVDIFKGTALLWYRAIKPSVHSWDQLVELLEKEFLPSHLDFTIWDKIRSYKQSVNQKSSIFIATMEALFARLHTVPSESVRLDQIMYNLHPYFSERLALHNVTSIAQLSELCRKLEDTKAKIVSSNPRNNYLHLTELPTKSYKRIKCWNCDQFDHTFLNCSQPKKLFCHYCGMKNVIIKNCPRCWSKKQCASRVYVNKYASK